MEIIEKWQQTEKPEGGHYSLPEILVSCVLQFGGYTPEMFPRDEGYAAAIAHMEQLFENMKESISGQIAKRALEVGRARGAQFREEDEVDLTSFGNRLLESVASRQKRPTLTENEDDEFG